MRRADRVIAAAFVTGAVIGLIACSDDPAAKEPVSCGRVAFTPRSDDGAFEIEATGVGCPTARKVAAATRSRRRGDPLAFTAQGFRCTGRSPAPSALRGVDWRCVRGEAVVSFTRN